jgi:mannose-6-phosphate isomerase-like protein (cupin superfamily)
LTATWRYYSPRDPSTAGKVPHQCDELYFVVAGAGSGRYRLEDKVTAVGPGDVLFCAGHVAHRFEEITADFPSGCCSTGRSNGLLSIEPT